MSGMTFWDSNLSYGPDRTDIQISGCDNLETLKRHMKRAGVQGGLVVKAIKEACLANDTLAEEIKEEPDLFGIMKLLPPHTGETVAPKDLPAEMKKKRFGAIMFSPLSHRYMARSFVIGDYLEVAQAHAIPVMLHTGRGLTLEQAADIMEDFPRLTAILTHNNCWPSDRELRPFVETFPNLHLDMTYMLTDNGIPELVEKYSARRILFGSGFPESYMGAHMLVIKHAEISEDERCLIAGENLQRLLQWEARHDQ